jgi:peptide subunit release factor 1 (eRF1)
MLNDRDLDGLLAYKAGYPVLSVYLNTDPVEGNVENHRLRLRSMLKDIELTEDAAAVKRYFDHEHDWSGRSVAIFTCAPESFWRVYTLAVPVRSRVRIDSRPHVKPLVDLLDSYGGYGVVLVDKQGARLFHFHLGALQEQDGVVGESVRRTKRGGGSQALGRRGGVAGQTDYVDEVAERNFKEAVDFATHFFSEKNVRRVLIGGTEDNVAMFRNLLPKAWQSLIVGSFPISMAASHNEVLDRAMEIGRKAEYRREAHLASTVVTGAAKGRGGAIDIDDTLEAIREGRVKTLLIREGFRSPGSRCKSCEYLSAKSLDHCPFCGGEVEPIPDVVELVVQRVMRSGGEVEVLHRDQEVKGFQQIGALLRY